MNEMGVFNVLAPLGMSYRRSDGNGGMEVVIADLDAFNWMGQVERFFKYLEVSELPTIEYASNGSGMGWLLPKPRQFFEYVLNLVRTAPRYIAKHFPYHEFSPNVEIFLRLLRSRENLTGVLSAFGGQLFGEEAIVLCDELNAFVFDCWLIVRCPSYEKILKKTKRAAELNFRSLVKYEARLFNRYSRLAVIRVDLFYRRPRDFEKVGDGVEPEVLVKDRYAFFRSLSGDERFKNLAGYAWKIEHGVEKGFHIHCIFFFDGSKVREDITYGRICGEKWIEITGERGDYWNCNSGKERYADIGVGLISHFEREKRTALVKAISYLTKPDYYLRLSDMVVGRIFGKGCIKDATRPAKGRPRLKGDDTNV